MCYIFILFLIYIIFREQKFEPHREQKLIFQILFIFKNCNEILILNKEKKFKMKIIKN